MHLWGRFCGATCISGVNFVTLHAYPMSILWRYMHLWGRFCSTTCMSIISSFAPLQDHSKKCWKLLKISMHLWCWFSRRYNNVNFFRRNVNMSCSLCTFPLRPGSSVPCPSEDCGQTFCCQDHLNRWVLVGQIASDSNFYSRLNADFLYVFSLSPLQAQHVCFFSVFFGSLLHQVSGSTDPYHILLVVFSLVSSTM